MAEIIGLVASVVQLAGTATAVSLTLFECARTIKSAQSEISGIASDISDLSYVLEHLGDVLDRHKDRVVAKTTETITRLIKRCDGVIEELRVTVELVKSKTARFQWLFRKPKTAEMRLSLEGFKSSLGLIIQTLVLAKTLDSDLDRDQKRVSATARRNIQRLRSAVVANKYIIEKLKDAEKAIERDKGEGDTPLPFQHPTYQPPPQPRPPTYTNYNYPVYTETQGYTSPGTGPTKSPYDQVYTETEASGSQGAGPTQNPNVVYTETTSTDEIRLAKVFFESEVAAARPRPAREAWPGNTGGIVLGSVVTMNTWETVLLRSYDNLIKQPPASDTLSAALPLKQTPQGSEEPNEEPTNQKNEKESDGSGGPDGDIVALLEELTKTSEDSIKMYQNDRPEEVKENLKSVPEWVRNEYTFTGSDPNNPADWEPNPPKPPPPNMAGPIVRKAYELEDSRQKPLCEVLMEGGGGYVWSHFNGNRRDYFVGTRKVLEYFIKSEENRLTPEQEVDRTIVSKQWVAKDILEKGDYTYKEYGEGGYAIMRKLTPSEVNELHIAASNRTEMLLRRLAKQPTSQNKETNPSSAKPKRQAKAIFDFSSNDAQVGELPFRKGDILDIIGPTEGLYWWDASLHGQTGRVPCNYIKMLGSEQTRPQQPRTESSSSIPQNQPRPQQDRRESSSSNTHSTGGYYGNFTPPPSSQEQYTSPRQSQDNQNPPTAGTPKSPKSAQSSSYFDDGIRVQGSDNPKSSSDSQTGSYFDDGIRVHGSDNVDPAWKKTFMSFKETMKITWREIKEENDREKLKKAKKPT